MKVRTKFTIWISLASLAAASVFSLFILYETLDEFTERVDRELAAIADSLFAVIESQLPGSATFTPPQYGYPLNRFWLKVSDASGRILFSTTLVDHAEIPPADNDVAYMVKRAIPLEAIWIPPDEMDDVEELPGDDKVKLRVRYFTRTLHGKEHHVHIAKPLLLLSAEFRELLQELIVGICITLTLIVALGYFLAGRILKPLKSINNLIREIRETSLNTRIPLPQSKDELYTLSASLNTMFDRLEHSFQQQRNFIGNAAHEMKSPLTILMLGHEEMLAAAPPEKFRLELEKQLFTMQRLNKLIRDLLSIARLEQQESLAREPVAIQRLIASVLHDYTDIIKAKGIELNTRIAPLTISADYEKLQRLFINLIDNGIKYNHESNGRLDIQAEKQADGVRILISNIGLPIPKKDLPYIFDQFFRVEKSRAQAYGGTGLGLTIAKRIVVMHGGTISVDSEPEATTFIIELPDVPTI